MIELSKYIMQQTRVRLFLQQTYNKPTTNLRQTRDRLWNRFMIELSKYIMQQTYDSFEYLSYLFLDLKHD